MKRLAAAAFALFTLAAVPDYVAQAIASKDRPPEDVARDGARHALALLVFSGAKPGDRIADFVPAGGYFTRLFSNIAGAKGHVFAVIPAELQKNPKMVLGTQAIIKQPAFANVTEEIDPTDATGARALASGPLDLVWTSDNYHDLYGFFGAQHAAAADAAIFRALKPGGVFVVVDHVALPGASATAPTTLHRIDPETVKAQVLAAGFVLDGTTDVLANPADTHTLKVFDPAVRGHTDQFAFRFRKPGK